MQLILSPWNSPTRNCALEEYLLTERPGEDVLLFYINRPSVIVGRNQSIEAEADTAYCTAHGIEVVRRLSGGGTVYHDGGNLNYAFLSDRGEGAALDRDFTGPVLELLRAVGVEAAAGPRHELLRKGVKISGTASHITRGRILFHGTLLHHADLAQMARALRGDPARRGRAVASVPARVGNLASGTRANESTPAFMQRLAQAWMGLHPGCRKMELTPAEQQRVARLEQLRYG